MASTSVWPALPICSPASHPPKEKRYAVGLYPPLSSTFRTVSAYFASFSKSWFARPQIIVVVIPFLVFANLHADSKKEKAFYQYLAACMQKSFSSYKPLYRRRGAGYHWWRTGPCFTRITDRLPRKKGQRKSLQNNPHLYRSTDME